MGGLSFTEQLACIGFKEIVRRSTIFQGKKRFEKWGRYEKEIISGHPSITSQSTWVDAWVKAVNSSSRTFHNDLALRDSFYSAVSWRFAGAPVIFCSSAYPVPYKGIHDAVKALAILKARVPNVRLRIAGSLQFKGIRRDGYIAWVNKLAQTIGVLNQIDWLGALTADQIVQELHQCSAMLMPSHCETYCVALAEAMYLGVPSVTAYTGGSAWLARDEDTALFFPPGDEAMCAYQLERVMTDQELAMRLSKRAREIALVQNDLERLVSRQLKIYRQVIAENKGESV